MKPYDEVRGFELQSEIEERELLYNRFALEDFYPAALLGEIIMLKRQLEQRLNIMESIK